MLMLMLVLMLVLRLDWIGFDGWVVDLVRQFSFKMYGEKKEEERRGKERI